VRQEPISSPRSKFMRQSGMHVNAEKHLARGEAGAPISATTQTSSRGTRPSGLWLRRHPDNSYRHRNLPLYFLRPVARSNAPPNEPVTGSTIAAWEGLRATLAPKNWSGQTSTSPGPSPLQAAIETNRAINTAPLEENSHLLILWPQLS